MRAEATLLLLPIYLKKLLRINTIKQTQIRNKKGLLKIYSHREIRGMNSIQIILESREKPPRGKETSLGSFTNKELLHED